MSDIAKRLIATVGMGVITQGDRQERYIAESQVMEAVRELDRLTTQVSELQAEKEQAEAKLAELRMEANTQKAEKEVYLNSRNALEKKLDQYIIHEAYNACLTGDCPHDNANQCVDALRGVVTEQTVQLEKWREGLERIHNSSLSKSIDYSGMWLNYPDKPEQTPASIISDLLRGD